LNLTKDGAVTVYGAQPNAKLFGGLADISNSVGLGLRIVYEFGEFLVSGFGNFVFIEVLKLLKEIVSPE